MNEQKPKCPPATDDRYLLKLKNVGKTDEFIAEKMGLTVQEVRRRWRNIKQVLDQPQQNGLEDLKTVAHTIGEQAGLLSHSLAIFEGAFADVPSANEFQQLIDQCPKDQVLAPYLLAKLIILRPFRMPTPQQVIEALEGQPPVPK